MEIRVVPNFRIGEIVNFKGASDRFLIGEIHTVTCTAGTQVLYDGIIINNVEHFSKKPRWVANKGMKVNEVLLEALPIVEVKEPSEALRSKVKELNDAIAEKEDLIHAQDFEKAAEFREKERKIRRAVDLMKESEGIPVVDISSED